MTEGNGTTEQIMTRYLLGQLSESERVALEEEYFSDPQIFDEITETESELVDDYVRGKLSPQIREQFEHFYLAQPKRRERVAFAETLATRLDQIARSKAVAPPPVGAVSWWQKLLGPLRATRLSPGFSVALVSLVLVLGGLWLFVEARRTRQELAQTQAARANQEQRERKLQQQIDDERARADRLAAELERLRNELPSRTTAPSPQSPIPAFVSFLVTVSSTRATETGPPNTLVIPAGIGEVRLQIGIKEHNYPTYIAMLQAVGGEEVFNRRNVKPRISKSGATITLSVPASSFNTGDYVLTLKAASERGEVEDFSKSIFHVEKE